MSAFTGIQYYSMEINLQDRRYHKGIRLKDPIPQQDPMFTDDKLFSVCAASKRSGPYVTYSYFCSRVTVVVGG